MQAATRVMDAVELLCLRGPVRLEEVAEALSVHKSNALRLMTTLCEREWATVNAARTHYMVGARLVGLGRVAAPLGLPQALAVAQQLVDETGESAHLCLRVDNQMMIVGRIESPLELKASAPIGRLEPLHCTAVGKVSLATMPDEQLEPLLASLELTANTDSTITNRAQLLSEIHAVRARGYAINNEEGEAGVNAIGVALAAESGQPYCVSVSGPAERFSPAAIQRMVPRVLKLTAPHNALNNPHGIAEKHS